MYIKTALIKFEIKNYFIQINCKEHTHKVAFKKYLVKIFVFLKGDIKTDAFIKNRRKILGYCNRNNEYVKCFGVP